MNARSKTTSALLCLALLGCGRGSGPSPDVGDGADPAPGSWQLPGAGFVDLPSSPTGEPGLYLALRDGTFLDYGSVRASTDGTPPRLNGLRFDPSTGAWTELAPEPFGPLYTPLVSATSDGFVVVGVRCDEQSGDTEVECSPGTFAGASYDAASRTWTELDPPKEAKAPTDASTAVEVVPAIGAGPLLVALGESHYLFEPASATWTPISPRPTMGEGICGTSDGFVSVRLHAKGLAPPATSDAPRGEQSEFTAATLDDGTWTTTKNEVGSSDPSAEVNSVICTGASVIVLGSASEGQDPYAYRFTPADRRWTRIDVPPEDLGYPQSAQLGNGAIVASDDGGTYLFDDERQTWSRARTDLRSVGSLAVSEEGVFVGNRLVPDEDSEDALRSVPSAARVWS